MEGLLEPAALGLLVSVVSEAGKLVPKVKALGKRGLRLLVLGLSALAVVLYGVSQGVEVLLDPALLVSIAEVYAASWVSYKVLVEG